MIKSEELTNPASCMSRAREDDAEKMEQPGTADTKAQRPCNSVLCQLAGMHTGQCYERAEHPIHTRTERPIQVGDTVRHKTDSTWGTQVVASIGELYVSATITDTPVFFEAGGFWRLSQLERVDPEKGPSERKI